MKQIIAIIFFALITICSFAQPQLWGLTAKGGADSSGNIFSLRGDGSQLQSNFDFTGMINKGSKPSLLCEGTAANKVYGITNEGGAKGLGTLFSYDYTTNVYTVLKQLDSTTGFDCKGGLTRNSYNNKLNGLMKFGGTNNGGTLIEYDEASNSFNVLLNFESFANGANPVGAITATGSMLYGCTTQGTSWGFGGVFSYNLSQPSFNNFVQVFNFSSMPNIGIDTDGFIAKSTSGKLYVCTKKGLVPPISNPIQGALLQIDPNNNNDVFPLMYFDAAAYGSNVMGNMVYQYGTEEKLIGRLGSGGPNGYGSIFEFNITTSSFSIKYQFSATANEGYGNAGKFGYIENSNSNSILGFTQFGGAFGDGTLYRYNINTATIDTLMSLQASTSGNAIYNEGGLTFLPMWNKWIGTLQNGVGGSGNIVEHTSWGASPLTVLTSFNTAPNGLYPQASLVEKDGNLYGTAVQGGNSPSGTHTNYGNHIGYGTMFKYHPQSSTFSKLIDFNDANGSFPSSDLYADNWGNIFGTTMYGGTGGLGTVFKYDIGSNTLQTMHHFDAFEGNTPIAGLTEYNGLMYGVTSKGGGWDAGTIFFVQPISNVFQTLHNFDTTLEGGRPMGKLFLASNNKFYGFTSMGSNNGFGGMFEFDPATNNFFFITSLDSTDFGKNAHGSFTELNNKLYATITYGGNVNEGVLIEYDLVASNITNHQSISGHPKGTPFKASDNKLYWLTHDGGNDDKGKIIAYDVNTNNSSLIAFFNGSNGAYPELGSLIEYSPCPTINPPASIHGLAASFCEGTTHLLYADTVTTAQNFNWTVPSDWTIISGQGTDTIHVTTGATSGNIEVNVYDGCSTSGNTSIYQGVIALPSIPNTIFNGSDNSCPLINQNYSTLNNGGADSFTWVVPNSWQIVSGQGTANVVVTTGNLAGNDTIKVKGNNVCGSSAFTTKVVHLYPSTPAQPDSIIGNAVPCNGSIIYSINPVDGASSYEWTLPSGWTGSSTGTTIVANVNGNDGNITVKAVGLCNGSKSIARTLTIARPKLATPSAIIGDSIVCIGTNATFSVAPVTGATAYTWTVPYNWVVIGGQNTNSITIKAPTNIVPAEFLYVTAKSNSCMLPSNPASKFIYPDGDYVLYSSQNRSFINGNATVMPSTAVTYTTQALPDAISYTWEVPNGWNILSGQGTTNLNVLPNASTNGNIKVTVTKSCNGRAIDTFPVQVTTSIAAGTPVLLGTSSDSYSRYGGSIFTIGADGNGFEVQHPFSDSSFMLNRGNGNSTNGQEMARTSDGKIYAILKDDYSAMLTVYNPVTNTLSKKVRLDDKLLVNADNTLLCAANDSSIYIAASLLGGGASFSWSEKQVTSIFKYNPTTNTCTRQLVMFPSNKFLNFHSIMQAADGNLYGIAAYQTNEDTVKSGRELFRYNPITKTYTTLNSFSDTAKGNFPFGRLQQGQNGLLYGITSNGGSNNRGTLYSYNIATNTVTNLHNFDVTCEVNMSVEEVNQQLLLASNNKLYGSLFNLGANNFWYLFEFDLATSTFSYKQKIDNLRYKLVEPTPGKIFGTTQGFINSNGENFPATSSSGTLFEYDLATGALTPKQFLAPYNTPSELGHSFSGFLYDGNGSLYGITKQGSYGGDGSIYKYSIAANTIEMKYSFGFSNGAHPFGKLIRAGNSKFYGITSDALDYYDGTYYGGYGSVIFEYDPATKNVAIKKRTLNTATEGNATTDLTLASNCKIYGFSAVKYGYGYGSSNLSNLFEYDPIANELTYKKTYSNGVDALNNPMGGMTEYKPGKLLGVSLGGNNNGCIFEYDTYTNTFTTKYTFSQNANGYYPRGGLLKVANGKFYGIAIRSVTANPFDGNALVIYEFNPYTNVYSKLYQRDFSAANGNLIEGKYGKLYGTLQSSNIDTTEIYEFDYLTNTFTSKKIANPYSVDGNGPFRISLFKASDGNIYGINTSGGIPNTSTGNGTIYKLDSLGNNFAVLHSFNGVDGLNPKMTQLTEINPITASTKYYSKSTGNLNDLNTWGSNTDGTGTAPSNFTSDNKVFIIANNNSKTLSSNWSISGFNTKVFVGNGTDSTTLVVPDGFTLTVTDKATLEVNNKGNILIAPNATLDVNNNASVNCNCNSNLTLQSAAAGTARLAPLTNGGYVYGNVKTERYIPGGYRKFRFLGHPFANPMNISEWTDDMDITGSITGTNANNFTPTGTGNPSAFTFIEANGNGAVNDAGWNPLTSSSTASQLGIADGIRVLIRGSKNQAGSLTGGTYIPNPLTLNMKGILNQGDITKQLSYSGSSKGWNLVANPYPSNINWNSVSRTNVNDAVYTYRPSLNGGTYASYINGSSTNGGSNILESHVGFFVRANNTGASLTFHENDKVATAQPNTMFRNSNTKNQIHSKLKLRLVADSLQYTDEIIVRFGDDNATDNFDEQYDAFNLAGNAHDLYALDAKQNKYSIYHGSELKPWQDEQREIQLGVTVANKGKYSINAMLLNEMANGNIAYLKDAELNTLTAITDSINYSFSITSNQQPGTSNRFSIIFNPKGKTIELTNGLTLSPNPSTANMFVLSTGKAYKQLTINLTTSDGKTLFTKETKGININQSISIQTPILAAGTYHITATSEHGTQTFQWMKL